MKPACSFYTLVNKLASSFYSKTSFVIHLITQSDQSSGQPELKQTNKQHDIKHVLTIPFFVSICIYHPYFYQDPHQLPERIFLYKSSILKIPRYQLEIICFKYTLFTFYFANRVRILLTLLLQIYHQLSIKKYSLSKSFFYILLPSFNKYLFTLPSSAKYFTSHGGQDHE